MRALFVLNKVDKVSAWIQLKLRMAKVIDFCNRLLGKLSVRVTGYSDNQQI